MSKFRRYFAFAMTMIVAFSFSLGNVKRAHAVEVNVGDYKFYIDATGGYIEEYNGPGGKVELPSEVNGVNVVGIDKCLLMNREDITEVVIPATVSYISGYVFRNCTGIKEISIPASVSRIDAQVFDGCTALQTIKFEEGSRLTYLSYFGDNLDSLENVYLPDGLKTIATGAFRGYEIKHLDIPKTVTEIGDRAFENCAYLEELVLPDGMEYVNYALARNCISLKKLVIGSDTIEIAEDAFLNCSKITDFTYGDEIRTIQKRAFYNCSGITEFVAPKELQSIKYQAFYGCTKLGKIEFNEGLGSIASYAFQKNYAVSSIAIPRTVTSIGFGAFANNRKLTEMTVYATFASGTSDIFASTSHETNLKYAQECTVNVYSNSQFLNAIKKSGCKVQTMKSKTSKSVTIYKGGVKVGEYITMKHGETFDLEARLTSGSTDYVRWTSNDTAMGTVDQKGKIRTMRGGVFQVTATTITGKEDYVTIIADDSANTGRKMAAVLTDGYIEKKQDDKPFKLKAKSYPSGKKIKYYTGNEKIASVADDGTVTLTGTGAVKLTLYTAETKKYEQGLGYTTILVYPATPKIVTASSNAKGSLYFKWKGPDPVGYEYKYWPKGQPDKAVSAVITTPTTKTLKISNLGKRKKYLFKIRAYGIYKGKNIYSDWTENCVVKTK